jgi:hypothetical protein
MSKLLSRRSFASLVLAVLLFPLIAATPPLTPDQGGGTIPMYCDLGDNALVRVRAYGAGVVFMDFYYTKSGYNLVRRGTWITNGAQYVSGWFINPGGSKLNKVVWGSTSGGHLDYASCL